MHNNEPTATLLHVLRDLSRTVQQMAQEKALPAIERDLLLAEMQQLYAQLLHWPVAAAAAAPIVEAMVSVQSTATVTEKEVAAVEEAPVAVSAPTEIPTAETATSAETSAAVSAITEQVMEQLAEVVEDAVEEALESGKEVALDIQLEVAEKEEEPVAETVLVEAEKEEVTTAATPQAPLEVETPAETTVVAEPSRAAVSPAARSVAFSLSGILQKNGDSQLVMAHLKLKPIDDLKSGIGLNEKFLFIRELFNNDHLAYADAIEQLNACNSIESAEKIIGEKLLPVYHWDLETEAAVSFLHLIFRRFASN